MLWPRHGGFFECHVSLHLPVPAPLRDQPTLSLSEQCLSLSLSTLWFQGALLCSLSLKPTPSAEAEALPLVLEGQLLPGHGHSLAAVGSAGGGPRA